MRASYSGGLTFRGYFCTIIIVAWPANGHHGNSSTKNHEDRPTPRGSPPPRELNRKRVVKQANLAYRRISSRLAISSPGEFLVFALVKRISRTSATSVCNPLADICSRSKSSPRSGVGSAQRREWRHGCATDGPELSSVVRTVTLQHHAAVWNALTVIPPLNINQLRRVRFFRAWLKTVFSTNYSLRHLLRTFLF